MGKRVNGMIGPIITVVIVLASALIAWGVLTTKVGQQEKTDGTQDAGIEKNTVRSVANEKDIAVQHVMLKQMIEMTKEIHAEAKKPRGFLGRISD